MVQELSFKEIYYLEFKQPLCSVEWKKLCKFGRRHHKEQFCEIILNLDLWFRRCRLKDFLSGALVQIVWNHLCNFGRRHYGNIHVKLF